MKNSIYSISSMKISVFKRYWQHGFLFRFQWKISLWHNYPSWLLLSKDSFYKRYKFETKEVQLSQSFWRVLQCWNSWFFLGSFPRHYCQYVSGCGCAYHPGITQEAVLVRGYSPTDLRLEIIIYNYMGRKPLVPCWGMSLRYNTFEKGKYTCDLTLLHCEPFKKPSFE